MIHVHITKKDIKCGVYVHPIHTHTHHHLYTIFIPIFFFCGVGIYPNSCTRTGVYAQMPLLCAHYAYSYSSDRCLHINDRNCGVGAHIVTNHTAARLWRVERGMGVHSRVCLYSEFHSVSSSRVLKGAWRCHCIQQCTHLWVLREVPARTTHNSNGIQTLVDAGIIVRERLSELQEGLDTTRTTWEKTKRLHFLEDLLLF